jgi:hypothetical protein
MEKEKEKKGDNPAFLFISMLLLLGEHELPCLASTVAWTCKALPTLNHRTG